jgi:hypothetical protein
MGDDTSQSVTARPRMKLPKGLDELVAALDRALNSIRQTGARTQAGIGMHSFASYHAYRQSIDQYSALDVTIRSRMGRLGRDEKNELNEILLEREGRFLTITIKAALDFFFALSAISILPLGTKELFERELEFLHSAANRLKSEEHAAGLGETLAPDLEMAEQILVEIMDKAPSFLDLGAEPPPEPQRALPPPLG